MVVAYVTSGCPAACFVRGMRQARSVGARYSHPHQLTAGGLLEHLSASRDGRTVRSFVTRRVADEDDARKIRLMRRAGVIEMVV
jgi:hypothetical protein